MLLTPSSPGANNDHTITLDLPDLCLTKSWLISDLWCSLNKPLDHDECTQTLRRFAGISEEDKTPTTDAVACLAFLYLLINIYGDKLKYGIHQKRSQTIRNIKKIRGGMPPDPPRELWSLPTLVFIHLSYCLAIFLFTPHSLAQ